MHAYLRRALCAVGLTGGIVLLGIGLAEAASADGPSGPVTTGESGILSGNQTGVDAQAPINASGNQVTVIGQDNKTTSTGGAATTSPPSGSPTTSGEDGIGSGNQTGVAAQVPVNISGNQVTVIGQRNQVHSTAGSASGTPAGTSTSSSAPTTSGQDGILSGNQTGVGLQVPVNVSGNQVTVIGQDNTVSSLGGSATGSPATTSGSPSSGPVTSGQSGIGSGNQTAVVALVPVNASGNQVTVIGQDNTVSSLGGSATGSPATTSGSPSSGPVTSGQDGILSGNQTGIAVVAPVRATGNQVTVIGQDNTVSSTGSSAAGSQGAGSTTGPVTSGENGIGSGNQTGIGVLVPISVTGNQVTVIGQDNTLTSTGTTTTGGGTTGPGETTTGEGGAGSGNQTPVAVTVPVDTSGNQVTVVGQDNTDTSTSTTTTGGTTPGGGTTSPPGGTVVSPPTTGGGSTGAQAVSGPVDSALPNTGAPAGLLGAGLLGLLLILLGGAILRGEGADQ